MNRDDFNQEVEPMFNQNDVTQPPMPPSQPRMPQSAQAPAMPVNNSTIEAQIAEAKKLLGVDALESELSQARKNSTYKDNLAEVLSKYPELTKSNLEAELEKLAQDDPNAVEFYKQSKSGLNLFAKSLKDTIKPKDEPDEITDDSSTSSASGGDDISELEDRIKKGVASNIEFGDYILNLSK